MSHLHGKFSDHDRQAECAIITLDHLSEGIEGGSVNMNSEIVGLRVGGDEREELLHPRSAVLSS